MFKSLLPVLPYREPKLLKTVEDIVKVIKEDNKSSVLLVTDSGIFKLGLTQKLEGDLKESNIKVIVYSDTVANPTTRNVEEALKLYKDNNYVIYKVK